MASTELDFRSRWERGLWGTDEFGQKIEKTRLHFQQPLSTAYRKIAEDEFGENDLLFLGIGTGQVPKMAEVEPQRITGIDVSSELMSLARRRLPEAILHQGRIQDILPHLQHFPVAIASEVLDCIDPRELPEVVSLIRERSDKLIAIQTFTPDDEFYALHSPQEEWGSRGGPGIEGWSHDQQVVVEERMRDLGINASVQQPDRLVDELQKMTEGNVGADLNQRLVDVLDELNFPFRQFPAEQVAGRPFLAQVDGFTSFMEANLDRFRDVAAPRTRDPREVAHYVQVHTTHRFAELLSRTLKLENHLTLLEHTCKQAGSNQIRRGTITAKDDQLILDHELGQDLNRAIQGAQSGSIPFEHVRTVNSGAFLNGAPMTFFEPHRDSFLDARLQFLIAE